MTAASSPRLFIRILVFTYVLLGIGFLVPSSAQEDLTSPYTIFQQIYKLESQAASAGWTANRLRDMGDLWERAGQIEYAVSYWERSVSIEPTVDLLQRLTLAYINGQMFDTALASLGQIQQMDPTNNWAIYYTALILAPIQPEAAIPYTQELLLHDTYGRTMQDLYSVLNSGRDPVYIVSEIAALYADRRLWPLAEYAFQYAAEQYAPFPDALAYTALMRAMQGKDSTERLREAIELAPESSSIRMIAGLERRINRDYEASLAALLQAVILEPTNPVLYHELNLTYQGLGSTDSAEDAEFLSQLLAGDIDQDGTEIANSESDSIYIPGLGISETALTSLSRLVEDKPDDQWLRAVYGWALVELGRIEGGITLIEAALANAPDDERVAMIAAQAYLRTGQLTQASALLTTVADSDTPYSEIAASILGIPTD
ncbi:MAG: tetratricopeptide repeat protein [Anaerolineae bacterium]|nr:tetratricopeptide repeat protein [Anaerolineae bacterium]